MHCPSCGLQIDSPSVERCPRCGYSFVSSSGSSPYGDYSAGGYGNAPQSGAPGAPQYYPPNYGGPASQNPYGPSGQSGQPGQQGQYGGYAPPSGYGQPAPPSGYGQPYGQAAPPSYPMNPGYPPGYQPPMYTPPAPPRKNRTGLIIGIVVGAVLLVALCGGGAIFALAALTPTTSTAGTPGIQTPTPEATPTPAQTVVYQNTFASDASGWSQDAGNCFWSAGGYHVANGYECYAPVGSQSNVDIKVQVQQVKGDTKSPYGLVFGLDDEKNDYEFMIVSNSAWALFRCTTTTCDSVLKYKSNTAIKGGLRANNTLEVQVQGTHFDFFVNGDKVGSYDDPSYVSGRVGVTASTDVESVFTNIVVTRPS